MFLETLTYLERAADQCSSIALLMLARENESIKKNHHAYLQSLHADGGAEYEAARCPSGGSNISTASGKAPQ